MFGVGPMELAVLAIVAVIVVGPERLPGFARQAAQMIRTLRDLSTGARQQLADELGPEFADVDLRNLNPRTAVRRVLFDDDFDFDSLDPRRKLRETVLDDEDLRAAEALTGGPCAINTGLDTSLDDLGGANEKRLWHGEA